MNTYFIYTLLAILLTLSVILLFVKKDKKDAVFIFIFLSVLTISPIISNNFIKSSILFVSLLFSLILFLIPLGSKYLILKRIPKTHYSIVTKIIVLTILIGISSIYFSSVTFKNDYHEFFKYEVEKIYLILSFAVLLIPAINRVKH